MREFTQSLRVQDWLGPHIPVRIRLSPRELQPSPTVILLLLTSQTEARHEKLAKSDPNPNISAKSLFKPSPVRRLPVAKGRVSAPSSSKWMHIQSYTSNRLVHVKHHLCLHIHFIYSHLVHLEIIRESRTEGEKVAEINGCRTDRTCLLLL